jgi:hypothetical protein
MCHRCSQRASVRGFKRHQRFHFHFTPTSGSWLNLVERWFAELTNKAVRRAAFSSVDDLQSAIEQFLEAWNEQPKAFVWTATIDAILAKHTRCRDTLEQIKAWLHRPPKPGKETSGYFKDTTPGAIRDQHGRRYRTCCGYHDAPG